VDTNDASGVPLATLVLADEPIAGVAERVAGLAEDEAAADHLRASLAADDITLPADRMGVPAAVQRVLARLRGIRPLDDLGEVGSAFELLSLHVPPGGSAALALRRSDVSARQVSIKAMGLGFGGGRKLTIAIDEDIAERGACMRVLQHVVLRVRRFATDAPEPLVLTDVVSWGAREMAAWPDCPHCGAHGDNLNPLEFEEDAAQALDLRGFDTAVSRETAFTLEGTRQADVGISIAAPAVGNLGAGFSFEQQTSIGCTASYTFPAGTWFVPYRRRGERSTLPFWATR